MTPALKTYIQSWLKKADLDLMSAQRMLEIKPVLLDSACFHCQQAIEKYLKGFLAFTGEDIAKTHNIIFLLSECSKIDIIFSSIDPLNINAYAVQGRYPDSSITPTLEETRKYYRLALKVQKLVLERIIFV